MTILRILGLCLGIGIVGSTFLSAVRTFVVPRSVPDKLNALVFKVMRSVFKTIAKAMPTYEQKDGVMAVFAPFSLLMLVPTWLCLTAVGYSFIYWALGIGDFRTAFVFSGSSILTLGFETTESLLLTMLAFTEATVGLILVAMLISYLPTMYSAFAKRETAVSQLAVRAGEPPTAPELIWRLHNLLQSESDLKAFWESWEYWFTEIDENHTSLSALVFFRSPRPEQSWVLAAGVILDGAALMVSTTERPSAFYATPVIRAGNLALRHIADFFNVAYNPDPHFPDDPIGVTQEEFNAAYDRLLSQGVPLKPDRELAWQNFAGWRVNYDSVLRALEKLTMSPQVEWLSDVTFVRADPKSGQTGASLEKVN